MRRGPALAATLVLIVVVLSACRSRGPDPDQRFATLITHVTPLHADTAALDLSSIDGARVGGREYNPRMPTVRKRQRVHRVAAGEHQIDGVPVRANPYPTGLKGPQRGVLPLVANFESGRRYFLALEPSETDSRYWQIVIWKVEDTEQGLLNTD